MHFCGGGNGGNAHTVSSRFLAERSHGKTPRLSVTRREVRAARVKHLVYYLDQLEAAHLHARKGVNGL